MAHDIIPQLTQWEYDHSLGHLAVWWIETFTLIGRGDGIGLPMHFDLDEYQFMVGAYALKRNGKRKFNRLFLSRAKGRDKSGKAAGVGMFEGFGPCRFDHWAREGETYTFMGGGGNVEKFRNVTGPEIAKKLKAQGVDVVLCTGGCGTCHRSATIVTRCCEAAGMSCCVIAALPPIARQQGAPRITAPHVPIGSNAGEPNNIPMQTAIVKESLEWVRDCPSYNQIKVLPYEYRHNV